MNHIVDKPLVYAISRMVSVIVISCPCAFGLAVPAVVSITLKMGIKHGILLKNTDIFNRLSTIDSFVFDKTGTLIASIDSMDSLIHKHHDLNLLLNIS